MNGLRAPFPWFGGKSRAASLVWAALGDVGAYCEPFAGSLACLLARPKVRGVETVVDRDAYLVNFWRALRSEPEALAALAEGPPFEVDLWARHLWLVTTGRERLERLATDPDFYDVKVAAWWLWGIRLWIGSGWCVSGNRQAPTPNKVPRSDPRSVPRSDPRSDELVALSSRLSRVRVLCGDWTAGVSPSSLSATLRASGGGRAGVTGVLLDPPYPTGEDLYGGDMAGVCRDVWRWAEEHGDDPCLRIVVCGHEGDWQPPKGWATVAWTGRRAYASQKGSGERERLWCSPFCLDVERPTQALLGELLR